MRRGYGEVFIPLPLGANFKGKSRPNKSSQTENLVRSDVGGICHSLQTGELFGNGRKSEGILRGKLRSRMGVSINSPSSVTQRDRHEAKRDSDIAGLHPQSLQCRR